MSTPVQRGEPFSFWREVFVPVVVVVVGGVAAWETVRWWRGRREPAPELEPEEEST